MEELSRTRLNLGKLSPFTTISELQSYASSLVMREPQAPNVTISADVQTFSVFGKPLSLPQFRAGLQNLIKDTEERMIKIMKGSPIPYKIPDDLEDNMSNTTRGYSWRKNGHFTEVSDPLLQRYLDDPDSGLAYIGPDGRFYFHSGKARQLLEELSIINRNLYLLHDTGNSQAVRSTSLGDLGLANGWRRRGHFRDFGINRLILQYTKTTNTKGADSFIPLLMASHIQRLDEMYVVIIQSFEQILAHSQWGESGYCLYDEYYFVQMGKRFSGDMIYHQFPRMFQSFFGVNYTLADYRLWAIAVMREYIRPEYHIAQAGDTIGDKASQHSTATARRVYSTLEGGLPYMTSDAMWFYDEFCRQWHDIIGLGLNPPPLALKIINKLQRQNYLSILPSAQIPTIPSTAQMSSTAEVSNDMVQTVTALKAQVSSMQATVNEQKAHFVNQLQTLREEMKGDFKAIFAQGLANLHQKNLVNHISTSGPFNVPSISDSISDVAHTSNARSSFNDPTVFDNIDDDTLYGPTIDEYMKELAEMQSTSSTEVITEEQALQALQDALQDERATWKSDEQRETVMETLEASRNIVSVMKTGAGKSMAWILASLLQSAITVVVVPFKRLLDQHLKNAKRMKCKAIQWTTKTTDLQGCNLIFIALETAASPSFQRQVFSRMFLLLIKTSPKIPRYAKGRSLHT